MAREVVLDANVIVALLDAADSLAEKAKTLGEQLRTEGAELVLLDVLVGEAVSVLCRRSRERRKEPPDIHRALAPVRHWAEEGSIRWVAAEQERHLGAILDVVEETAGRLSFNDALLVVLQRAGEIGDVASFDTGFDCVPDFRRVAGAPS
jgi:predicted nucleic acid-binding protein